MEGKLKCEEFIAEKEGFGSSAVVVLRLLIFSVLR
jgi:hypothetical protein